ncbi:MAG: hypothetical protein M3439_01780 [Chloroflexota bacterium]|nr:hypothetical protein [Chloroflexota bacterium]
MTSWVPVEAEGYDEDGVPVWFILHVRDGYLHEFEISRANGERIYSLPDVDTIAVTIRDRWAGYRYPPASPVSCR